MSNLSDLGLGPIDQVAYIVEDMEVAVPRYEALFGPFTVSEQTLPDCTVRGETTDLALKMAVSSSNPVEIELIQPVKGESPWSEHLANHGEGLHHVRFKVTDIDGKLEGLAENGFETLMYKRFGPEVAFAYVQTPESFGGHIIELLELP
jgi:4-hydroxyphenylpyruvate dioxygenase-like putative hemolysin